MNLPTPPATYRQDDQAQLRRSLEQAINSLQRSVQALESVTYRTWNFVIDGGGSAITTGTKGTITVTKGRVTGWAIEADQVGSIVVDVQKSTGGGAYSSIAGSEKPTLSSAQTNSDSNLTTWSPLVLAGDSLKFIVDSSSTVTRATVSLTFLPMA